jgi:hypothetical protein
MSGENKPPTPVPAAGSEATMDAASGKKLSLIGALKKIEEYWKLLATLAAIVFFGWMGATHYWTYLKIRDFVVATRADGREHPGKHDKLHLEFDRLKFRYCERELHALSTGSMLLGQLVSAFWQANYFDMKLSNASVKLTKEGVREFNNANDVKACFIRIEQRKYVLEQKVSESSAADKKIADDALKAFTSQISALQSECSVYTSINFISELLKKMREVKTATAKPVADDDERAITDSLKTCEMARDYQYETQMKVVGWLRDRTDSLGDLFK